MKKGDVVTIRDTSYSKRVENGELKDNCGSKKGPQFTIVETDCKFPNPHKFQCQYNEFNNTVIQAIDSGVVVFIQENFLRLAVHKITIDDKTVEISNESYTVLKRSLEID